MQPTPTVLEIERVLAAQDEALRAAYRALAERGAAAVRVAPSLVERLEEVCQAAPVRRSTVKPIAGIRC